jgi:hypothetical protein
MGSSIVALLKALDLPKPLRIMFSDGNEQKDLHKTTQSGDGEQMKN